MPILNTCCRCFTTRTGTLIIGILQLIASLLLICGSVVLLVSWETLIQKYKKDLQRQVEMGQLMNFLRIALVIVMVLCIVHVVLASLLIHGVRKMRPRLMLPYMVITVIGMILGVIIDVMFIVRGGGTVGGLIGMAISPVLGVYFLLVVYSHYQELKDRDGRAGVPSDSKF